MGLLATVPVLVTSLLVGGGALQLSNSSLTHAAEAKLTSLREVRKQQLTDYFGQLSNSLQAFAVNATVVDGFKSLRQAYAVAAEGSKPETIKQLRDELKNSYLTEFATEFAKRNPEPATGLQAVVDALEPAQVVLQHAFITANPNPLGEKNKLAEPSESSNFGAIHAKVHPSIEAFRSKTGFYDIFLIDTQTDRIIYTAFKELDFTSSLADGPSSKTGLGDVYQKVKAAGKSARLKMSDYAPYFISYNDQAAFLATPILEGENLIGVLAAQVPLDQVTAVMTGASEWDRQGLGSSGESYLVGPDLLMRTDSRFMLENKNEFLKAMAGKLDARSLALGAKKGTSVGIVKIESEASKEAIAGRSGFSIFPDYREVPVLSAYGPLDILGLRFAVIAEQDEAEALAAATELRDQLLLRSAVVALGLLAIALAGGYVFVRAFVRPIHELSALVQKVAGGDDEARSNVKTGDELQELGDTFNRLLDDRIASLANAARENEALNESVVSLLGTMFELSQRNLTVRANVSSDIVGTVADSVNMVMDATATALTDVKNVAAEVARSSNRVSSSADAMSVQAQSDKMAITTMTDDIAYASSLMQQVAELADKSRDTAKQATSTTLAALKAVTVTVGEMSGIRQSMSEMEKRVKRLGERSQEISQIVTVINSISERTHVLALNASMQAAMAGEAGRGFAVVTEEVQRLADASRNATMQIAQLAQNIQLETSETVAALNRTVTDVVKGSQVAESSGEQMRETEAATGRLAEAVQQIASESARQLELAARLASQASNIARSADQTEKILIDSASDAAALAASSTQLVQVVSEFRLA